MAEKSPIKFSHSSSWNRHRNKKQSREFWGKHRARSEDELKRDFEDFLIDKEREDVKFRE